MTSRTINGLIWDVATPSHWQLRGYPVEIAFLGDAWFLSLNKDGDLSFDRFDTRQAAMALVEKALLPHTINQSV